MAGHGYLKHGSADAHALIDEQSRQIDALRREIFAKGAGGQRAGKLGLPVIQFGIVDELTNKGVTVTFLHENLSFSKDTTDPRADLMLGILGSFAEFERAIIRERQAEGIALAKKAGKYKGRKPALNPQQVVEIKRRVLAGESKAALAREFGVTRPTVYRALKNA